MMQNCHPCPETSQSNKSASSLSFDSLDCGRRHLGPSTAAGPKAVARLRSLLKDSRETPCSAQKFEIAPRDVISAH